MPSAARVQNGIVADVVRIPPHVTLGEMFHPDAGFFQCADDVEIGMSYADGEFGPAPAPMIFQVVPTEISDRQFYQQLAIEDVITQSEALSAVQTGAIPGALASVIDAMPVDQQFGARMLIGGAVTFERAHPLTTTVAAAIGWSAERVDDFFIAAARL